MNVDEKSLAAEMFKKMNLPVPQIDVPEKPPQATKKLEVSESESSESETDSEIDEESKSKFQAVQRYKNQKPLTLRPD